LAEHPAMGTGQVERLKGDLSGYWSRRLNKKDRMIYKIDDVEAIVHLLSFKGHYE
jgi:toxin YoeB